jgi:hypothetical protein
VWVVRPHRFVEDDSSGSPGDDGDDDDDDTDDHHQDHFAGAQSRGQAPRGPDDALDTAADHHPPLDTATDDDALNATADHHPPLDATADDDSPFDAAADDQRVDCLHPARQCRRRRRG